MRYLALLLALLTGCSESGRTSDGGRIDLAIHDTLAGADLASNYAININDQLLGVLEVRFVKGRCLGRARIDADTANARAAVVAFAREVATAVPPDGQEPDTDDELKALVPTSGQVTGWTEETTDGISGPWLISTNAFDWINGAGKPFADNGFEAVAGEKYTHPAPSDAGSALWTLDVDLVNQGSMAGATTAFTGAGWDQGSQL